MTLVGGAKPVETTPTAEAVVPVPTPPTEEPVAPVPQEEPRKEPTSVNIAATKPKAGKGKDNVQLRLQRVARAERRKLWAKMGLEGEFDDARFDEAVAALATRAHETVAGKDAQAGRVAQLEAEARKLRADNMKLVLERTKLKREADLKQRELEDREAENEVRTAAVQSGILDPEYGLELFKRQMRSNPPEEGKAPDIAGFFSTLREDVSHKYLFERATTPPAPVPAGPPSIAEQQRAAAARANAATPAPAGQTPAGQPPEPKPAAPGQGEPVDVDKMSRKDFGDYALKTYGYRVHASGAAS